MPQTPIISIIVPVYNKDLYVSETLTCLQQQTYTNWEALVIDDCSDDNSWNIVKEFAEHDSRIKPFRLESNRGAPHARNIGIKKAKGDYIIFLDADDILTEKAIENRIKMFNKNRNIDFTVSSAGLIIDNKKITESNFNPKTNIQHDDLNKFLTGDIPWVTVQPTWHRRAIEKIGEWDENLLALQDHDYSIRALCLGLNYKKIPEIDCFWRRDDTHAISRSGFKQDILNSHDYLFDKTFNLLKTNIMATPKRLNYLASRYFWLAQLNERRNDYNYGYSKYWNKVKKKDLTNNLVYYLIKFYFNIYNNKYILYIYRFLFNKYIYKKTRIKVDAF